MQVSVLLSSVVKHHRQLPRLAALHFSTAAAAATPDDRPSLPISKSSLNRNSEYNIVFVRHGQSTWNRDNRFIGWTGKLVVGCDFLQKDTFSNSLTPFLDTPLTDDGVVEATVAGQMLEKSSIRFDAVHTSMLRRCIRTVNLVLMEMGQEYLPLSKSWRLNERSYGDLVGRNKKQAVCEHGVDQVKRWRRSYDEPPPPMSDDHDFHPAKDPRYQAVSVMIE